MLHNVLVKQLTATLARPGTIASCIARKQLIQARLYHGRALIGKREVVGFGTNGSYSYIDRPDYPYPAIRFREDNQELVALRAKEKGDWKSLTLDEKKTLYRASYCRTFAEMLAPTGDWKAIAAMSLFMLTTGLWLVILVKKFAMGPMPESTSMENRIKQLETYLRLRVNPIEGISSKWDYENNRWK